MRVVGASAPCAPAEVDASTVTSADDVDVLASLLANLTFLPV